MKIILSIKPEFVAKIFSGEKKFEYRKAIFAKREVNTVLIYSTMPVGKIVGEFTIKRILEDKPLNIWNRTSKHSGIELEYFNSYFEGREKAFALQIENFTPYEIPLDPKEEYENFFAPQSFMYVN